MAKPFQRTSLTSASRPTFQSPLQRITSQYQAHQSSTTQQTQQEIQRLSTQRQRVTTAAVTAQKPVQQYLQQAGNLLGRRVGTLQTRLHEKMNSKGEK